jgi:hypothetical protein
MPGQAPATPSTVGTTNSQGLSDWAAPYITDYLGKAKALAGGDYQTYQGPLTAGSSDIQNKVFQGIGNLAFPTNLGQSFTSTGAPTIGANGQPTGGTGVASQYMNPYLQNVLDPQIAELQRQASIAGLTNAAKANQYGAFGGSRAALMDAELNRNTQQEMNKTIGTGYANAYDNAMKQFNTEQGNNQSLAKLMTDIGGIQRGITAEGVAADKAEFEAQRQFPYEQVKFMRDMITGLPVSSVSSQQDSLSGIAQLVQAFGGMKNLGGSMKNLGIGS